MSSDQTVILTSFESASCYPDPLRRVCYRDPETASPHRLTHRGPASHWWTPTKLPPPPREPLGPRPPARTPEQRAETRRLFEETLAEQRAERARIAGETTKPPHPSNHPSQP